MPLPTHDFEVGDRVRITTDVEVLATQGFDDDDAVRLAGREVVVDYIGYWIEFLDPDFPGLPRWRIAPGNITRVGVEPPARTRPPPGIRKAVFAPLPLP